jgi:hypothetical protein
MRPPCPNIIVVSETVRHLSSYSTGAEGLSRIEKQYKATLVYEPDMANGNMIEHDIIAQGRRKRIPGILCQLPDAQTATGRYTKEEAHAGTKT